MAMAEVDDQSNVIALDQGILTAIDENDVGTIDRMLRSNEMTVNHRLTNTGHLVLSVAISMLKSDIVAQIFKTATELGQTIKLGEPMCKAFLVYSILMPKKEMKEIMEILISEFERMEMSKRIETAFIERDGDGWNALVQACYYGLDDFVVKFLDLIQDGMEPASSIDWFWDRDEDNVFRYFGRLIRTETRRAMIDRIPFTKDLVNAGRYSVPLSSIIFDDDMEPSVDTLKLLIQPGLADMDVRGAFGQTILFRLIDWQYVQTVETFLRCGCEMDICNFYDKSPLSIACHRYTVASTDSTKKTMAQIIELLLAFGVSLQKEPYLYEIDELPNEFRGVQYKKRRSAGHDIDPKLLEKLKALRRSNELLSLMRISRKAIRQHLKPNADEIIPNLDGVSPTMKKFLLMENEDSLLFSLESGDLIE